MVLEEHPPGRNVVDIVLGGLQRLKVNRARRLTAEQQKFREQLTGAFGQSPFAAQSASLEEMTRHNMALFEQAFSMFNPFAAMTPSIMSASTSAHVRSVNRTPIVTIP